MPQTLLDVVRESYTLVVDDHFDGTEPRQPVEKPTGSHAGASDGTTRQTQPRKPAEHLTGTEAGESGGATKHPDLDPSLWLPHHLPQWSSREDSAARYHVNNGALTLLIEEHQAPWCPEFDGQVRVSSIQTGVFAGPVGSSVGQHQFSDQAVVREAQETQWLYTPTYGVFRLRAKADLEPGCMVALWMIGVEDEPHRSGVVDVMEIFGTAVTPDGAAVGMNVKAFGDPALTDDEATVDAAIDVATYHSYGLRWTPEDLTWYLDDEPVRQVAQSPDYPMQFMLGLYQFDTAETPRSGPYPKRFSIDRFQAWEPTR
ncbi:glycoside hydrolase family 16 protein [Euzebya tangerina]|uniref:glycoside hydrolase family 16 protein n=1 Tax=Euzebya tangerina TaxID=591198 RepID=UPI000E31ADC6|nr:glycoside hydrolase family 16 protein [Euzebya tangerina]